jgi:hypothetical protein
LYKSGSELFSDPVPIVASFDLSAAHPEKAETRTRARKMVFASHGREKIPPAQRDPRQDPIEPSRNREFDREYVKMGIMRNRRDVSDKKNERKS